MDTQRKNIILFSFDDSVPFYRYKNVFHEPLSIPNLEQFCAASTVFQSAYCQSPICGPSRASFMSGRTPHETGVFKNNENIFDKIAAQEMWSYKLKENGYFCSSGGKMHHYYKPLRRKDHKVLYNDARKWFRSDMRLPNEVEKVKYGGLRRGFGTPNPDDDSLYYDHQSADSAIEFLQGYDGDAPFYREIGFYTPHGPRYTPSRYKDIYNFRNFRKPAAWDEADDLNPYAEENYPQNIADRSDKWWRMSVRNYYSALSHGDYHFGRIMAALKASKYAENTVVIMLSDHGFHLGNKNRFRKTTLWEQVAAVPFVIFDPSQPEAREVTDPVAMLDVGPTILDYAGLPPLENCAGQSVRPLVEGASAPERVVPTFHYDDVSIRYGDYRLIRYSDRSTQFYDLKADYWQMKNLGQNHATFKDAYAALIRCAGEYGLEITK